MNRRRRERATGIAIVATMSLAMIIVGTVSSYVTGRILFPEMGLRAPGFGTWFAVVCVAVASRFVIELLKAIGDDD